MDDLKKINRYVLIDMKGNPHLFEITKSEAEEYITVFGWNTILEIYELDEEIPMRKGSNIKLANNRAEFVTLKLEGYRPFKKAKSAKEGK